MDLREIDEAELTRATVLLPEEMNGTDEGRRH